MNIGQQVNETTRQRVYKYSHRVAESQSHKVSVRVNVIVRVCVCILLTAYSLTAKSQDPTVNVQSLLKENNRIIKTMLDYRYKGGSGAFERDFFLNVDYNKISRESCTIGTTIMQFTVDCDGTLGEFNIINPLNDYISSQLQKFFLMTEGNWNECQNSDYEYFEVPILFTIEGLETEAIGFITNYDEELGCPCKDDSHFYEEFEKYKNKKPKKALKAIEELIRRNPYNEFYIEERNKLVENLKN